MTIYIGSMQRRNFRGYTPNFFGFITWSSGTMAIDSQVVYNFCRPIKTYIAWHTCLYIYICMYVYNHPSYTLVYPWYSHFFPEFPGGLQLLLLLLRLLCFLRSADGPRHGAGALPSRRPPLSAKRVERPHPAPKCPVAKQTLRQGGGTSTGEEDLTLW